VSYLLDTNIISFYIRGETQVVKRLTREAPSDIAISSLTAFELNYGIAKRKSPKLTDIVRRVIALVTVLPFDEVAAAQAGVLKAKLEMAGKPSALPDLLIAAHALTAQRILVTNNTKHFAHIKGLKIEDWTQ
jgi:tRNA(fMet)-specific endonuclease VapC